MHFAQVLVRRIWRPPAPGGADGSSQAAFEAGPDARLGQFPADEHDAAQALFVVLPRALMVAVENHVHPLEHEALGISLEGEDALAAQDVLAFLLHQGLHPGEELVRIERRRELERDRLHLLVMIVLEPAGLLRMVMIMIMIMVMVMVMVMVMIVSVLMCVIVMVLV